MFNMATPTQTPGQGIPPPSGTPPPPPPPGTGTPSTQGTGSTTPGATVLMPTNPKMGGIVQITATEYSAWTGGKPKVDWSGLDDAALTEYKSPNQLRPVSVYSQQKAYNVRKMGLKEKFEEGGDLAAFQTNVLKHLQDTGMDAVAYLPNPQDPTEMINVIENHSRFTVKTAIAASALLYPDFDKYDITNDTAAREFLLDSLDSKLGKTVDEKTKEMDTVTFVVLWLQFIECIQVRSVRTYDMIMDRIKARHPSQFPGQNIKALAKVFREDARVLDHAGHYDQKLTMHMLEAFLKAGGAGNEEYRLPLRLKKLELDKELLFISHVSPQAAKSHMVSKKLTFADITDLAEESYATQYANNEWPPAMSIRDTKSAPAAFDASLACGDVNQPMTAAQLNALIQTKVNEKVDGALNSGKQQKSGNCHNCGKPGHWARECPDKQTNAAGSNGRGRAGANNGSRRGNNGNRQNWKKVAPKPGEPIRKLHNGVTFEWCGGEGKCNRWTTTHNSASHEKGKGKRSSQAQANLVQIEDPSVWNVSLGFSWMDLWLLVYPFLISFLLGASLVVGLTHQVELAEFGINLAIFISKWYSELISFVIKWNWSLVAPILWMMIGVSASGIFHSSEAKPLHSRRERRHYNQTCRRYNRKRNRRRPGSIRDHGLHRRYPLHLRSAGHYMRPKPPDSFLRAIAKEWASLRVEVRRLLQFVDSNGHAPERIGREGEGNGHCRGRCRGCSGATVHNGNVCRSNKPRRRRNKPHPRPRREVVYRPMPSHGCHGPGNLFETRRQAEAMNNILNEMNMMQCNIGSPEDDSPTYRMALQAPTRFRNAMSKYATFSVIWDSGASISVSFDKRDFVGPLTKPKLMTRLKGIAKGLTIEGQGHVLWAMHDTKGMLRLIKVPAFYVPKCRARLLSTTSLLQAYPGEKVDLEVDKATLSGMPSLHGRGAVVARVDPTNNLPTSLAYRYDDTVDAAEALTSTITTVDAKNRNLTEPEKELLKWHNRLGHLGFKKIQFLMRTGILARSQSKRKLHELASKLTVFPKCAACQFGKQCRRPSPGKKSSVVRDKEGALKKDHLQPGQCVSIDHFVCSTKGRLFSSFGKTKEDDMYDGGCIFVDHASGFVHVIFQAHLNSHESLKAKEEFEMMCRDFGVIPQMYQSDNGASFVSSEFSQKLSEFVQVQKFAGVGAHHHNGVAERSIQTIMSIARTMMLHAAIHWPDIADPSLWPMAVQHAVFLHNHVPDPTNGLSPNDIFGRTRWEQSKFHDLHVWGCPVYVLDKTIADGKKIPRWKPRSRRSINMGLSSKHASTVPLVLNPDTGAITTAFHVVFDDWFATVASTEEFLPDFNSDEWSRMFGDSTYQYPLDEEDEQEMMDVRRLTVDELDAKENEKKRRTIERAMEEADPNTPLQVLPPPTKLPPTLSPKAPPSSIPPPAQQSPNADELSSMRKSSPRESSMREPVSDSPAKGMTPQSEVYRKESKTGSAPRKLTFSTPLSTSIPSNTDSIHHQREKASTAAPEPVATRRSRRIAKQQPEYAFNPDIKLASAVPFANLFRENGLFTPLVLKAAKSDPDTFTFDEAMADEENREEWLKAMGKEIDSLVGKMTWDEVPIGHAKTRILPGTWVFKIKRNPMGEITKFKARYCVRGDLQEGDFKVHSPTVAWSTVRLFLVLSLMFGWFTCTVDFANAFVQAALETPVWIHLPRGFRSTMNGKTCLRLKKSLYGLSVAPRLWHEHLLAALIAEGFVQSENDPCLFMKKDMLIVLFVDDAGIAVKNKDDIDVLIQNLTDRGFELTREGSFSEFLGIKFVRDDENNTINATQPGLIQKIIKATGMEDCNPNRTPALTTALGIDPDGELMSEDWSYPSIVGMLLYLSTNTRPDICYAVSQVARFNHSPKKSHATAVKMIVRYLKGTADKGTIIRPTGTLALDTWVDASFGNLYRIDPDSEPSAARSRTGWIIHLGGCPILWRSQLQTTIALATAEAEYGALAAVMRVVIPMRRLLIEVADMLELSMELRSTIHARVFEDNNAALSLATNQQITSRTKHYLIQWHFFWEAVREGLVVIEKVDTKVQRADYATKGLPVVQFEFIRKLNQGW